MEKSKIDINILGQDVSVMCTDDEKRILLKSRDRIVAEAEKVKETVSYTHLTLPTR